MGNNEKPLKIDSMNVFHVHKAFITPLYHLHQQGEKVVESRARSFFPCLFSLPDHGLQVRSTETRMQIGDCLQIQKS